MSWLHEVKLNGLMLPNYLKSLTLTYATTLLASVIDGDDPLNSVIARRGRGKDEAMR